MNGLIIKDLKFLISQKKFLFLVIGITAFMAFKGSNSYFSISYLSMIGCIFTINTISYDEADKGYEFLFSLPISRKKYVTSKYIFGILLISALALTGIFLCIIGTLFNGSSIDSELIKLCLTTYPGFLLAMALTLPFKIKFGNEKSTYAIALPVILILVTGMGFEYISENFNIDASFINNFFNNTSAAFLYGAFYIIAFAALFISIKISIKIMEKKEF